MIVLIKNYINFYQQLNKLINKHNVNKFKIENSNDVYKKYIVSRLNYRNFLTYNLMKEVSLLLKESYFFNDEQLEKLKKSENYNLIVAFNEKAKPKAFCLLKQSIYNSKELNLEALYVSENEQNNGIAQVLLKNAYKYAKNNNYKKINLIVTNENKIARHIYEKNNFIYIPRQNMQNYSSIKMTRSINNNIFNFGAVAFELIKRYKPNNMYSILSKPYFKPDYNVFSKYENLKNEKKFVDKILKSTTLKNVSMFYNEVLSKGKEPEEVASQIQFCYENNIDTEKLKNNFPLTFTLSKNVILKVCEICEIVSALKVQEKFLKYENENNYINEKIIEVANQSENETAINNNKDSNTKNILNDDGGNEIL